MKVIAIFLSNIDRFLLIFLGCGWMLQGLNVLPGSFMTGHLEWTLYGAILVAFETLLIVVSRRR